EIFIPFIARRIAMVRSTDLILENEGKSVSIHTAQGEGTSTVVSLIRFLHRLQLLQEG
ncbi:MAG: hypothetical protein ACI9JP_001849, partial [Granulosicoccus sp.]